MQRRAFTKLFASSLLVPLLRFQPETIDRHQLLSMFLRKGPYSRYDLTRPYVVGDHSYASDYHAMARIVTDESEHDEETIKAPPVAHAWNRYFVPGNDWKSFRLAELAELVRPKGKVGAACPKCFDRRVSYGPNYPTDQEVADSLPEYDPDDNTIRDVSCDLCRGQVWFGPAYQPIDSVLIGYRYASLLAKIPGCEVTVSSFSHALRLNQFPTVLFRSEVGISGIVMPVING